MLGEPRTFGGGCKIMESALLLLAYQVHQMVVRLRFTRTKCIGGWML